MPNNHFSPKHYFLCLLVHWPSFAANLDVSNKQKSLTVQQNACLYHSTVFTS